MRRLVVQTECIQGGGERARLSFDHAARFVTHGGRERRRERVSQ
jgi:hypothetical protein